MVIELKIASIGISMMPGRNKRPKMKSIPAIDKIEISRSFGV